MANLWPKLDAGLQHIYSNFLHLQKQGIENAGYIDPVLLEGNTVIHVLLLYKDDLASIENIGFKLTKDQGAGHAAGFVDLRELEKIADHPNVIQFRFGIKESISLDTSVIEITARKALSGGGPFVWEVDRSTGTFQGDTGLGVIVGIIDTGIDFKHKVFLQSTTPPTTRILRIWDQSLTPTGLEKSPNAALMDGGVVYGVEYTDAMINDILLGKAGAQPIRHKDCAGHGTHVASTAAGDGRQAASIGAKGFNFVGVAPKAFIISVKTLLLDKDPVVGFAQQVKDAFSYIIKTAQDLGLPAVINCSFGGSVGPHDGLEPEEIALANQFKNVKGLACVFSAGNTAGKRQHAIITMPGPSLEVPFELFDDRTVTTDKTSCISKSNTSVLFIDLWYNDIRPDTIQASLLVPGVPGFSAAVALGGAEVSGTFDGAKRFTINHTQQPAVISPTTGATVIRNRIIVSLFQEADLHKRGIYVLKLESTTGTKLHAWCQQSIKHGLRLADPQPAATAASVNITDDNTISGKSCVPNIITVAAYDDKSGNLAKFSSRGPVVDYSVSGPVADKPDLAAPGVQITAARSSKGQFPPDFLKSVLSLFYIPFNGTSMSAPHVTGVVALMLQKNNNLTNSEIISKLRANTRTAPSVNEFGQGKVGAKKTSDAV
jgi:subtilisin family serine protease